MFFLGKMNGCRAGRHQQALAEAILKDPAVDSLSSFIGVDGANATLNTATNAITNLGATALGTTTADASGTVSTLARPVSTSRKDSA